MSCPTDNSTKYPYINRAIKKLDELEMYIKLLEDDYLQELIRGARGSFIEAIYAHEIEDLRSETAFYRERIHRRKRE